MHYLQKMILDKLRYDQPLTYTALMPEGIESSHFRYHLKQLMADKLVQKTAGQTYALTSGGQTSVDYLSANRTTPMRTPKVITYTLLKHGRTFLLQKKDKEPYRGLIGLIGGKVHFGEEPSAAAKREVSEKTGLDVPPPRLAGVADIRIFRRGTLISHACAYVHVSVLDVLPPDLPEGLLPFDDGLADSRKFIPDLLPLIEAIEHAPSPFVLNLSCTLQDG